MALESIPQAALSELQDGRSYVDNLANKYIVKPKNVKGIGGFVFDYEGETQAALHAEITDHYAEDNGALNDHIAVKPLRLTLKGFVAEIAVNPSTGLLGALSSIQSRLSTVPAYLGKYTPQATAKLQAALTQAQSITNQIDQGLSRVQNIVGLFGNAAPAPTKQKQAFLKLQALGFPTPPDLPQIFAVDTPFGTFDNMALESVTFVQPEETKFWADLVVVLKQMRFAQTFSVPFFLSRYAGRAAQQAQSTVDNGITKGTPEDSSIAFRGFTAVFGQ